MPILNKRITCGTDEGVALDGDGDLKTLRLPADRTKGGNQSRRAGPAGERDKS